MKKDWEKSILTWRENFERDRKSPYGWLSLIGLDFLEEGDNVIGSSKEAQVRLPNRCQPQVGIISLEANKLFFSASPGANVRWRNQPVIDPVPLTADDEDTRLEIDQIQFHVMRRGDRYCVRSKDPSAPSRRNFEGTLWFPPKPEWVLEGRFVPSESPRTIEIPNALGGSDPVVVPGTVDFLFENKKYSLAVQGSEEGGFFIVFGDLSNGQETYPPGRFLTTPAPRLRKVKLDFNRAFNPPCALTAFATCPYPPAENRLPLAIDAGEQFKRP